MYRIKKYGRVQITIGEVKKKSKRRFHAAQMTMSPAVFFAFFPDMFNTRLKIKNYANV